MIMHSIGPFGIEGPSKFQPGCSDGGHYALTIPGNGKSLIVAECFRLLDHGVEVSAIDNARLFAASHEMKQALERLVAYWDKTGPLRVQYDKLQDYIVMAKHALDQAEGK